MKKLMRTVILTLGIALPLVHSAVLADDVHGHSDPAESHDPMSSVDMAHGSIDLSGTHHIPSVDLRVHRDAVKGWNIQVVTQNFRFAPEHANTKHVPGEGHAHLYIDGTKRTRLYVEWYYLEKLPPGTHHIEVTLNSNTHDEFTVDGERISDVEMVMVPAQ